VVAAVLAYLAWKLTLRERPAALPAVSPAGRPHAREPLLSKEGTPAVASVVVALLGAALGLWVGLSLLRDSVIARGWYGRETLALMLPAGLALAGLALRPLRREALRAASRELVRAALFLHLGIQAGTAYYQAQVDYSTTYDYGQEGLAEAAKFVQQRTGPDDLVTSMKDLGFLADRRYVENYGSLYDKTEARRLIEYWETGRVRYIVFTEGIGPDQVVRQPMLQEWLAQHAELAATFGHYRIYQPLIPQPLPPSASAAPNP
jgi:hypothetical protein